MTFRAKPVVKRGRPWERSDRRNFLTNLGFGLVVVVAVLILVIAAAVNWYNEHLSPVGSVNGQSITRDEFTAAFRAEAARYIIALRRIDDEFNAGRLTASERDSQQQSIEQRAQQLGAIVLERIIDGRITENLATQEGISVAPEEVEAQIDEEATLPEQRHLWLIEVEPEIDDDAEEPTAAQKAAARTKADQALADLNGGKSWDEVSRALSTSTDAATGGDRGWITDESGLEQNLLDAIFALEQDAPSAVVEGEDGVFRIARVTEIVAEERDPVYREALATEGVDMAVYRRVVHNDLLAEKLSDKIKAQALGAGPQREVKEIFIGASSTEATPTGAVKVRHILYAPKDDPDGASTVPPEDPAWKEAEDAARAAYARIAADKSLFDELAREESDETGADSSGGKLGYLDPSMAASAGGQLDQAFADAIFKAGLKAGDLIEPVKSAFGWHVIQVMYYPPDIDQANKIRSDILGGADFATLARDFSDGEEAADGGELGWVARFQRSAEVEKAIFEATVGQITTPVVIEGEGIHLFLVTKEETRTPDAEQAETLENEAFSNWYQAKKTAFVITRDDSFVGG
jgi:parvulin-like peptidyl-prolyl isomerase